MTALEIGRPRRGRVDRHRVRTLLIPDDWDRPVVVERIESDERSLCRTLDASVLQCISGPGWHCYLEEDAHASRPLNPRATRLLTALGSVRQAHGPAMFLDHGGREAESDVTAYVLAMARRTGLVIEDRGLHHPGRDSG